MAPDKEHSQGQRRHQVDTNTQEINNLSKEISGARGQIKVFAIIVTVLLALFSLGAQTIWSRTTDIMLRTEKIRDENAILKDELKDMINSVRLQLAENKTGTEVTKEKLNNLQENLNKNIEYVLWVQEAMVDNGLIPSREKK